MAKQRVIGLLAGMSWESSALYYRIINETVRDRLGGLHSARCLIWSFDFDAIAVLQRADRWEDAADLLIDAARRLERAGAECLLICANTMHLVADAVAASVDIPLLHVADGTGAAIRAAGMRRVGLLGTAFTMQRDFYKARLRDRFGIDSLVPEDDDIPELHRIIYDELTQGRVEPASGKTYRRAIQSLVARGAEGIILGCTELVLLVKPEDSAVPLFDTTRIHAQSAVDWALHG